MFFINSGTVLDKYLQEVRRLIYTTNTIEGFNRQLRKVTKAKSVFPTDDSLLKSLSRFSARLLPSRLFLFSIIQQNSPHGELFRQRKYFKNSGDSAAKIA